MRYEIRELDIGGVLDHAINLTKDNFWLFLKIALVLMVPFNIISGLILAWDMPEIAAMSNPAQVGATLQPVVTKFLIEIWVIAGINMLLVFPLTDAATTYAIANSYLGKPVGVVTAYQRALKVFVPLIITWILTYIVICIGFVLLIVPGIIFALWFMLVSRVVVIEGTWGPAAMKRSKQLMKGNMGNGFVLAIIMVVIGAAFNWLPRIVSLVEVRVLVSSILQAILTIFFSAAWVVFYFSCRCKAENFDLTMLADAVVASDQLPATG
jgi:hypothetical protein